MGGQTLCGRGWEGRRRGSRNRSALPVDGVSLDAAVEESEKLLDNLAAAAEIIADADDSKVTPPNRASIILLAEENGRTCLLTGDAAESEILDGLREAKQLTDAEPFRCNVLKVQHHGSEHNVSKMFATQVHVSAMCSVETGRPATPTTP